MTVPATITVAQAAPILGASPWALYASIRSGECPAPTLRLGRKILFPTRPLADLLGLSLDDLAALLDEAA